MVNDKGNLEGDGFGRDLRTWQDLLWSRDPAFLREAADLAESLGRAGWAVAMRASAEDCEEFGGSGGAA